MEYENRNMETDRDFLLLAKSIQKIDSIFKDFYCDLVFYHRVLKCHIIIELKTHKFNYADFAQLNMYVAYYKKNFMQPDDNPPIGILLCTEIGEEQVKYATAGMDQQLFVSKYLLKLPPKEKLSLWLNQEIKDFGQLKN